MSKEHFYTGDDPAESGNKVIKWKYDETKERPTVFIEYPLGAYFVQGLLSKKNNSKLWFCKHWYIWNII